MMDHPSDRASGSKPHLSSLAPLAVAGAVMTAGLTAYLAWPAPRSRTRTSTRKRLALIAYLRDHLGGSDVAIRVVRRLGSHEGTEDGPLFRRLSREFEEDRSVVRSLLIRLRASERSIKRAAADASGVVLSATAGGEPGDLSLLRTLEALAMGVQGKRCMWRALQSLPSLPSTADGMTFLELEAKAVRQWEAIEERRRALVERTFSATEDRTG